MLGADCAAILPTKRTVLFLTEADANSGPDNAGSEPRKGEGQVYRSAFLAIATAWSMRVIGLVSILILARTLTPADFGIVALAMATLAVVDVFSALGLKQALLRVREPERSHYDTVWTIQLIVLTALALVLVALGPVMAWFYREPVLAWIIAILSSRFVFYGLSNIGVVDFERNMEFGRDLQMRIVVRLTAFFITITAALILRNYWALVIGAVVQGALHCAMSYIFHPYRPRFSLVRRAEMLGVSGWMFLASAAQTFMLEIERFVVGRIGALGSVGFYSVSKDLSSIFTLEIATALNRVTFVTTAKTGKQLGETPLRLQSMLGAYAMIAAPMGLGLAATADSAVRVLLGEQWGEAAPYLQYIAPAAAFYAVFKLIISSLQASGKARFAALLALASALAVAGAIIGAASFGGTPLDVARMAMWVVAAALIASIAALAVTEKVGFAGLLMASARPFLAGICMLAVVQWLPLASQVPLIALIASVAIGAVTYAACTALLWLVSGRPQGAEANMFELAQSSWRKISAGRSAG